MSTVCDILREKDHIHITSISVHCYNWSLLRLAIVTQQSLTVPNLKFNFVIGMCVLGKMVYRDSGTIHGFRYPLGVLECVPSG